MLRQTCSRALICAAMLACSSVASAQDKDWYIGGGALLSTQSAGVACSGSSCPNPGIGGTARGVSAEVGVVRSTNLTVALEVGVPGRFETAQYNYFGQYLRRHRDVVFSGVMHVTSKPLHAVQFAAVLGPSIIYEDTKTMTAAFTGGVMQPSVPSASVHRVTFGITVGGDVSVRLHRHVELVPEMRVHSVYRARLNSSGAGNASASLALGEWVIRPAVALRIRR